MSERHNAPMERRAKPGPGVSLFQCTGKDRAVTTDPSKKIYNDHNVYIIGAGFSAEAGMPLVKDFMYRMRDAATWLDRQSARTRERDAIAQVLQFRLKAAAAAHRVPLDVENIEELFSLASASGNPELARALPLAIAATLDHARIIAGGREPSTDLFRIGLVDPEPWGVPGTWQKLPESYKIPGNLSQNEEQYMCPIYESYLGVMAGYFDGVVNGRKNTIITFNYDMVVEEALTNLGIEFAYGLGDDMKILVGKPWNRIKLGRTTDDRLALLKLHGSVNWAGARDNVDRLSRIRQDFTTWRATGSDVEEPPVVPLLRGEIKDRLAQRDWMFVYGNYDELQKDDIDPLLVPPAWQKYLGGALSRVWDRAVAGLRTATRIIVIGYSAPPTDQHFRYLLAAGMQDNVSLRKILFVNPALDDDRWRLEFESRLFGKTGLFRPEHRDQGVIELLPLQVRAFLAGVNDDGFGGLRGRIGRPLNAQSCTQVDARVRYYSLANAMGEWR